MKKILWLVFFCLLLSGCKKNPFDYRTKFIGKFNFSVHNTAWTLSGPTLDTTYSYSGEIQNGSENNTILITFSENVSIEATIYEDGTLDNCICSHYGYLKGEFESTKKIHFSYRSGGLGGGSYRIVTGEKK